MRSPRPLYGVVLQSAVTIVLCLTALISVVVGYNMTAYALTRIWLLILILLTTAGYCLFASKMFSDEDPRPTYAAYFAFVWIFTIIWLLTALISLGATIDIGLVVVAGLGVIATLWFTFAMTYSVAGASPFVFTLIITIILVAFNVVEMFFDECELVSFEVSDCGASAARKVISCFVFASHLINIITIIAQAEKYFPSPIPENQKLRLAWTTGAQNQEKVLQEDFDDKEPDAPERTYLGEPGIQRHYNMTGTYFKAPRATDN